MNDRYTTPEGFTLPKPLVFPDVRHLGELLTVERPWDFATMNHRNGNPQADTPDDITREGYDRTVGRFLSVRNLPGGHWMVTPTDLLLAAIYGPERAFSEPFVFFDRVGFQAIYHENNGRVLLVAQASGILASRWLAYLDAASMPKATRLLGA